MTERRALLALEDGALFAGRAVGAAGEATGEVVFNTAMTGYQEILTDPSYSGQLVCLTYPLIGNYGVNEDDPESRQPWTRGLIVRELAARHSNWRATGDLGSYLKKHGIVGIDEVDTRALTRHLRLHGAKTGVISTVDLEPGSLVRKALAAPKLGELDLVRGVTAERIAPLCLPADSYDALAGQLGGGVANRSRQRASGCSRRTDQLRHGTHPRDGGCSPARRSCLSRGRHRRRRQAQHHAPPGGARLPGHRGTGHRLRGRHLGAGAGRAVPVQRPRRTPSRRPTWPPPCASCSTATATCRCSASASACRS